MMICRYNSSNMARKIITVVAFITLGATAASLDHSTIRSPADTPVSRLGRQFAPRRRLISHFIKTLYNKGEGIWVYHYAEQYGDQALEQLPWCSEGCVKCSGDEKKYKKRYGRYKRHLESLRHGDDCPNYESCGGILQTRGRVAQEQLSNLRVMKRVPGTTNPVEWEHVKNPKGYSEDELKMCPWCPNPDCGRRWPREPTLGHGSLCPGCFYFTEDGQMDGTLLVTRCGDAWTWLAKAMVIPGIVLGGFLEACYEYGPESFVYKWVRFSGALCVIAFVMFKIVGPCLNKCAGRR